MVGLGIPATATGGSCPSSSEEGEPDKSELEVDDVEDDESGTSSFKARTLDI